MPSIIEIKGREEEESTRGLSASRRFLADWADRWNTAIPQVGDAHPDNPYLFCTRRRPSEDDDGNAIVVCTYENEGQLAEEFYEYSADFSAEVLDTTKGMKWKNAGTPVDIPIPTIHPITAETITVRLITSPRDSIRSAVGKVNDRKFHGAEAGHLLLEGASVRISRDPSGNVISAQSTFRFLWREREHNEVWREAQQAVTKEGILIKFHNDPSATDDYWYTDGATAHAYDGLVHQPGEPVYILDPVAGKSDWDKPCYDDAGTERYRYKECDFATVLGLPTDEGDDAPGEPEP